MKRENFSLQLRKKVPAPASAWLLLALRQDALLWSSLNTSPLGELALEKMPAKSEPWTPAALSLLSKLEPAVVDGLRSQPLQPFPAELQPWVEKARREWDEKPQEVLSLERVGAVALSLRQGFLENASWQNLGWQLSRSPKNEKIILACLLGVIADPVALLHDLALSGDLDNRLNLALHGLLCQPLAPFRQQEVLKQWAASLPWGAGVALVDRLAQLRPWMGRELAQTLLAARSRGDNPLFADPLAGQFDQLTFSLQQVRLLQQAGQPVKATGLLVEALKNARQLQGHISARLAQAVAQAKAAGEAEKQETDLEAWRQAVRLAPGETSYSIGLAQALVNQGRLADAQLHLGVQQARERTPAKAELLLVSSQVAHGLGDKQAAARFARQALEQLENGGMLDASGAKSLFEYLNKAEQPDLAVRTLQAAVQKHPVDAGLSEALARQLVASGRPSLAAEHACTAAAVHTVCAPEPEKFVLPKTLRLLLVDCQEGLGAWQDALNARIELLDNTQTPKPAELHAIARGALNAGYIDQSMAYSRRALEINPEDDIALGWLGKAQTQGAEYISAIDTLRKAVRIAPQRAALWLSLAEACKLAGMEAQRLEILRSAVQALPEEAEIYLALGEVYLSRGAPTQALTYLRQAANLADTPLIGLRLGQTLYQLGHQDEARLVLEEAYRSQQEANQQGYEAAQDEALEIELKHAFGRCLLASNERARAVELLESVAEAQPEQPAPQLDLSKALLKGQPTQVQAKRAVALLQKSIHLILQDEAPTQPKVIPEDMAVMRAEAVGLLAEAYAASGDFKHSQDTYLQAMDAPALQKPGWRARLAMGFSKVALKLDQPETAVTVLKDTLQKEPQNIPLQRALAEAYLANGLAQDAYDTASGVLAANPVDLDVLSWFVTLGERLRKQPGALQTLVQLDMVRALQSATQLAPDRGDFLVQLGKLLLERGDRQPAQEVFRRLSALETDDRRVDAMDLFQVAKNLREWGDPDLSVALLQMAIEKTGAPDNKERIQSAVPLVEMYRELSVSHQKAGNVDSALQAVDRAISIEPRQTRLHLQKADIYRNLRKPEAMLDSLKPALELSPDGADVHQRVAQALYISGDLPGALKHAEQVLSSREIKKEPRLDQSTHFLAAEISYAMLKPRQALAYLPDALPEDGELDDLMSQASLQAEIALDNGERDLAETAVRLMRKTDPDDPRGLAAGARLAFMDGDLQTSKTLLQAANNSMGKISRNKKITTDRRFPADRERSCCRGSSCLRDWKKAYEWACKGADCAPEEPVSHFLKVEVIIKRAEEQALCQDLQVTAHAPGADALGDEAFKEFEAALQDVERTTRQFATPGSNETSQALNLWRTRGLAVFKPEWQNAASLEEQVLSFPPSTDDVSAMLMAYRRCNQPAKAVKAAKTEFIINYGGKEVSESPLVLSQLALAYARFDINQALENADKALNKIDGPQISEFKYWPELPMLYTLQASLALQAGLVDMASQAIQKALAAWPEEPRWHALAAQIYQGRDVQKGLPDLGKARTHLELATRLEPANAAHFLALGKVYQDLGDLARAAQVLEHASKLAPKASKPWMELARIQLVSGELEQAALSAERALQIAPDLPQALVLRGEIALQAKNPKAALNRAESALQNQPDQVDALKLMANSLEALGRSKEALALLEKALTRVKDPMPMHYERLQLLRRSKGMDQALPELQKLADGNQRRPELLALLADWQAQAGQGDAAAQSARSALQNDQGQLSESEKAALHYQIGLQAHKTGQLDQAIHAFSQAILLEPEKLQNYLELARTQQDRREHAQAIKTLEKAMEIAPESYQPYYLAGTVYKDNKEYAAAERMLRKAAKIAPREVSIHRMLGAVVALNLVHNR